MDRRINAAGLNMFMRSQPPTIPLANVEKKTHNNTHIKIQLKRSPSLMSEDVIKENKQNDNNT